MSFIIKSCRYLLLLLLLAGCNDNGEPATLFVLQDSAYSSPEIYLVSSQIRSLQEKSDTPHYSNILKLAKVENGVVATVPVICEYRIANDTLIMRPKYMIDANAEFEALAEINNEIIKKRFTTLSINESAATAKVLNIFPSSDNIPINILMFHVTFNTPMNEDVVAFQQVKLIDEKGDEKKMVWREKSNWTSDGKHLILMIHPGWVKREIHYMDKYGPQFEEGKKYTLIITKNIKDKFNRSLQQEYKKEFTIVAPDRKKPEILTKKIGVHSNTRDTLFVSFSEAMDYGSALAGISILDESKNKVEGRIWPANDYKWAFTPNASWEKKQYTLQLTEAVFDIASNHFHRLFEETDAEIMKPAAPVLIPFFPN